MSAYKTPTYHLHWEKPLTSSQASNYLMCKGFVAAELYDSDNRIKDAEIEKLRCELAHTKLDLDASGVVIDQRDAEIERLKRELQKMKDTYDDPTVYDAKEDDAMHIAAIEANSAAMRKRIECLERELSQTHARYGKLVEAAKETIGVYSDTYGRQHSCINNLRASLVRLDQPATPKAPEASTVKQDLMIARYANLVKYAKLVTERYRHGNLPIQGSTLMLDLDIAISRLGKCNQEEHDFAPTPADFQHATARMSKLNAVVEEGYIDTFSFLCGIFDKHSSITSKGVDWPKWPAREV